MKKSEFIDSHLSQRIDDVSINKLRRKGFARENVAQRLFLLVIFKKKIDYLTITNLRNLNLIP